MAPRGGTATAAAAAKDIVVVLSSSSSEEGGGGGGGGAAAVVRRVVGEEAACNDRVQTPSGSNNKSRKKIEKRKEKSDIDNKNDHAVEAEGAVSVAGENKKKKRKKTMESNASSSSSSSPSSSLAATTGVISSGSFSFPMSRVWRLVRCEGNNTSTNTRTTLDAVFLINKATEMFLKLFAEDAYAHAIREHKKCVTYKHLSSTVHSGKRYEFLSDFVPEKLRAEDALKEKQLVEP